MSSGTEENGGVVSYGRVMEGKITGEEEDVWVGLVFGLPLIISTAPGIRVSLIF